ncbi:MAG: hypothetical protein H6625_03285 [Bdellovibrionaceae bacterium]|nr:hypothetical protein [Pseudobdellovibrionaceae bacterium]
MNFYFKAPAKTFLFGEYGVLKGGPAILLNTAPQFGLQVQKSKDNDCHGIHPMSPAGKWLRSRAHLFNGFKIEFNDPWLGSGGFGASSAQFLFVHLLTQILQGASPFIDKENYIDLLLKDFFSLHEGEVVVPSGVDLVSQYLGGVTRILEERSQSSAQAWPFDFKNFVILKTGNKVNSHEHLRQLQSKDLSAVIELAKKCEFFFEEKEWSAFVESINHYQGFLNKNQWVCDKTQNWVREILSWPEVEAVKGCGALGADSLVILCDDSLTEIVKTKCLSLGLQFVGDKWSLSDGLVLEAKNKKVDSKNDLSFKDFDLNHISSGKEL